MAPREAGRGGLEAPLLADALRAGVRSAGTAEGTACPSAAARPLWAVTLLEGTAFVIAMVPAFSLRFRELAKAEGLDAAATAVMLGRLQAVRSAVEFVATPTLTFWSDRTGRRPVMLLCATALTLQMLCLALARSLWAFGAVFVAFGLLSNSNGALEATCIADATEPGASRSLAFGRLYTVIGAVMVVGPLVGGWLTSIDGRVPFFAGAALCTGGVFFAAWQLPEYLSEKRHRGRVLRRSSSAEALGGVLRGSPSTTWFICASVFSALGVGAFASAQVLWLREVFGFDSRGVGSFLSLNGLLLIASQGVLLPRLLKAFSGREARLVQLGLLWTAAKLAALGLAPSTAWLWAAQIAGIGGSCAVAPLRNLCTKAVPESHQGALAGTVSGASTAAQVVGSVLGSQVSPRHPLEGACRVVPLRGRGGPLRGRRVRLQRGNP
ncbi:unnamed protein product [Prorocentrum cordatum]|uniref:Major facilitator superfamily (MFS) profile domain-containing protein n=1 Tax=Prorocentrum cordatum TaxID=2364126 RepID=A0ABN9XB98_9DINO|nr:unnamed protein product [Polarella glacialis]